MNPSYCSATWRFGSVLLGSAPSSTIFVGEMTKKKFPQFVPKVQLAGMDPSPVASIEEVSEIEPPAFKVPSEFLSLVPVTFPALKVTTPALSETLESSGWIVPKARVVADEG